jgi:hypothetical protein
MVCYRSRLRFVLSRYGPSGYDRLRIRESAGKLRLKDKETNIVREDQENGIFPIAPHIFASRYLTSRSVFCRGFAVRECCDRHGGDWRGHCLVQGQNHHDSGG